MDDSASDSASFSGAMKVTTFWGYPAERGCLLSSGSGVVVDEGIAIERGGRGYDRLTGVEAAAPCCAGRRRRVCVGERGCAVTGDIAM